MTDRELLEAAANAAGVVFRHDIDDFCSATKWLRSGLGDLEFPSEYWNPLTDDGDALRLAVKLRLSVVFGANYVIVSGVQNPTVNNSDDPYAATRRAIVRAAAEIGKEEV